MITPAKTSTPEQWRDAVAMLNDWLENEYGQNDESMQIKDFYVESFQYEAERHRLAIEFEDQFFVVFGFDEKCGFCAAAWKDNSLGACLERHGGGAADEDSLKVLEMAYTLPNEVFENGRRTFSIHDSTCSLDIASPEQTALFTHLIDRLIELGEICIEPCFQFGRVLEYSQVQQTVVDAVGLLWKGTREARGRLEQDWDCVRD